MAKKHKTTNIKNYINGKWISSRSGKKFRRENPAFKTRIVGSAPRSNKQDVDAAVKAAKNAFPAWRDTPAPKRGEILFKAVQILEQNKAKLGDLVANEMGKVKSEAYGDVQEAIDMGYYMAGEGRRLFGETVLSYT